ncbi:putative colicin V production protein [Gottschalkia acidurici 9a]|uniref:Colicin V production protein n=1 Tax=Gottschalkia acidurici (strain ATCC 7906 / DSM 604 / BCRC 14475 / CIP 104303 / KCTC 5404 / NCIMB 10678 / 9a) TaxID=1128398 RepID=K0B592_GOTA9|nr:CvpA family protein [Gottschalkia acidurici]AFS79711.1 putative colicin V production protein [Gottschalkia acidurici 9a]
MLDIIVIVVLALYGISGWRRGLILSIFGIVGYILSAVIAKIYSPDLTNYIINNTNIANIISQYTNKGAVANPATNIISDMAVKSFLSIVTFMVIFFITSLIISRIGRLINKVASLPILDGINSFGGMAFGLCKGLIITFIILAFVTFAIEIGNDNNLNESIAKTVVVKFMYDNNPIVRLIENIVS